MLEVNSLEPDAAGLKIDHSGPIPLAVSPASVKILPRSWGAHGSIAYVQAPATFSTPTIGTNLVLLGPEAESGRPQERQQSPHVSPATTSMPHQAPQTGPEAFTGELALVPPMLGSSQQLLNRDHFKAYYEVWQPPCLHHFQALTVALDFLADRLVVFPTNQSAASLVLLAYC